jgi:hypothetical protein
LSDLGDSEQTPCDLGTVVDYTHLTAMRAPRPTLLTFNSKDQCCFASGHALRPLLEGAWPIFALHGAGDSLRAHVNDDPGTHNYERENREKFYQMCGDFFFAGKAFDAKEIECGNELKSKEELGVIIPVENQNFNSVALAISKMLPRAGDLPTNRTAAEGWQKENREKLKKIVAWKDFKVTAASAGVDEVGGVSLKRWKLRMDETWTVPAVELARAGAHGTVIVVHDGGRKEAAAEVEKWLAAGKRVVAIDPWYFGESKVAQKDYLFALLMLTIGDRPLGLQASEVAGTARWIAGRFKDEPITVVAVEPRCSTFALVAGAVEEAIGTIELNGALGSLKEVIEKDWTMEKTPEMFCFGLLEAFDVAHIAAMAAPRKVTVHAPSERAKAEMEHLKGWYAMWGMEWEVLR